ncbi:MAG: TetR/AcrR family transcriptional regulator [Chitinophagaceae bacterium]|nr:TetR/AcrR family transcriptional regulator [Chitinophagaceae bacterium]
MPSKGENTKQWIIEKAAPVFNTKGYAATSMNDILRATGLAKGGIYGNFASKDELAVYAFDYNYSLLKTSLIAVIRKENKSAAKLKAILHYYKNYTINPHVPGGCPLMNTAIEADDNIPFLKGKAAAALKEMLSSLEYIVKKGIADQEFTKTLNVTKEAAFFFAIIEGGVMMSKLMDAPKYLNNNLEMLKERIEQQYLN